MQLTSDELDDIFRSAMSASNSAYETAPTHPTKPVQSISPSLTQTQPGRLDTTAMMLGMGLH